MAAKTQGLSGPALFLAAGGALIAYAGIKGSSPLDELRNIITGQRPEPLSTTSGAAPLAAGSPGSAGAASSGNAHTTGKEAPHVAAEMQYISSTWGVPTYGWRTRGSVPGSDHPKGLAIDAMVGKDRGKGDAIAAHYVANADRKRVKYVIWYGRIWNPGRGWKMYFGPSPHRDHPHISFYAMGSSRAF